MYMSDNESSPQATDVTTPTSPQTGEIYQRINSLLDERDQPEDNSLMQSMSNMWGLHTPRGPLVTDRFSSSGNGSLPQSPVGFGRRKFLASTPFSAQSHYKSEDDIAYPSPAIRTFQRNIDISYYSTPNSPMPIRKHPYMNRYNDCGSPLGDSLVNSSSRSLSPPESVTSSSCVTDSGLADMMGSMNLHNNSFPQPRINQEQEYPQMSPVDDPIKSAIEMLHHQQQSLQASLMSLMRHQQQPYGGAGPSTPPCYPPMNDGNGNLERAAMVHRNAAGIFEATYTWTGSLPPHTTDKNAVYSTKVFLGGVPWDLGEETLEQIFAMYGPVRVVWPGKEQMVSQPKGFAYLIFESEKKLKALLNNCVKDFSGSWYFRLSSRRMKAKEVQVIPWAIADCNFAVRRDSCQKLDPQKTVFVGALHGMITAEGLATIMTELFDGVIYAGIDTDKHKYPIGSARVTFSNTRSYMKAVAAAFIEIKTDKFTKTIQVDPYLEDSFCSRCRIQQGPYFCREMICFRYFCMQCWSWHHSSDYMNNHKPLMRNSRNHPIVGFAQNSSSPERY